MEIINKPEKIFIQIGDETDFLEDEVINYDALSEGEITFHTSRVFKTDLSFYSKELMFEFAEYARADAADSWGMTTEQLFKQFLKNREE